MNIKLKHRGCFVKTIILLLVLTLTTTFCGCGISSDMPFNGEISFHKISAVIPEKFIRDSTQSSADLWIFEHGNYKEYIILSRKDIEGEATTFLQTYVEYMKEQGSISEVTTFLEKDAVYSSYTRDEMFCQEILFAHGGSFYAIALRGGNEDEFRSLLDSVKIHVD